MIRSRRITFMSSGAPALLLAVALAALTACSQQSSPDDQRSRSLLRLPDPNDVDVIDEEVIVALALAKNHHLKAKVHIDAAQFTDAIREVEAILRIPFPKHAAEAEDIQLDARALLGTMLAAHGRLDDGMSVVDQGIGSARRDSFFLANLYTVKGELHQARALLADDSASVAQRARNERRSAIEAFDCSIAINTAIQKQLAAEMQSGGESQKASGHPSNPRRVACRSSLTESESTP